MQYALVNQTLLEDRRIVVQNVRQVRNVLVISLVLIHDALIHVQEYVVTMRDVVLLTIIRFVVVIQDLWVIHSFNAPQSKVRVVSP